MAQKKSIKMNLSQVADLDKLESLTDALFVTIADLEEGFNDSVSDWSKTIAAMLESQAEVTKYKKDADALAKEIEASFKSIGVPMEGEIPRMINYINEVYPKVLINVKRHREEIQEKMKFYGKLIK